MRNDSEQWRELAWRKVVSMSRKRVNVKMSDVHISKSRPISMDLIASMLAVFCEAIKRIS